MVYFIWALTFIICLISYRKDKERTHKALINSFHSFKKLSPGLFCMIFLVGFMLAIIPKESIEHIFTYKGFLGFVMVSVIGAIVTIPGPIAFPLAGALLSVGASKAMLASFITTLTMVGLVSAPLEISYFGKRFTLLRQGLSFISAVMIGFIMGEIL
jgi:uncharacterized membrane protein YraQ (UPF0718 family)